jgi:hypothetical protein
MRRVGRAGRVRYGALVGSALLVLAGCGDDDGSAAAGTNDAGSEASNEAAGDDAGDADPDTDPDAEPDEGADDSDTLVPAEVVEENGMATLRPPDDTASDCGDLDQLDPGASFAFPTDDDGILDAGPGPVRVEFVGCSNTFEANLVYDAFHGEDLGPTLTESTMGGSMGDWEAFSFEEIFWTPGRWTVVIYEDDAATGDRQEYDRVTFSID